MPYWYDAIPPEVLAQPSCVTPDCCLKVCDWASKDKCYCCTENEVGREEMRLRWESTHDDPWTGPKYKVGQGHKWNARINAFYAKKFDMEQEQYDGEE